MNRIAATAAAIVGAALAPTSASAEVYQLYQFQVTSWGCPTSEPCGGLYNPSALNALRVGVSAGYGGTSVKTSMAQSPIPPLVSEYFSRTSVARIEALSIGMDFRLAEGYCRTGMEACMFDFNYLVDSALETLLGSLYSNNWADMFEMSSSDSGLWTGLYTSDFGPGPVAFSGVWYKTPEPSPVALIGAGLAGLLWVRRRKDTREQA